MRSFHNSTGEVGPGLRRAEEKALTQEERVLEIFRGMPEGAALSPEQVLRRFGSRVLLQSLRRGMTNLEHRGLLIRTGKRIPGDYGVLVGTYTLAPESGQVNLFREAA